MMTRMIVEPEFFLIELDSVTLPGPVAQSPIKLILRVSERLHFEVIKRVMSPEKFWDFPETDPWPQLLKGWIVQCSR